MTVCKIVVQTDLSLVCKLKYSNRLTCQMRLFRLKILINSKIYLNALKDRMKSVFLAIKINKLKKYQRYFYSKFFRRTSISLI